MVGFCVPRVGSGDPFSGACSGGGSCGRVSSFSGATVMWGRVVCVAG